MADTFSIYDITANSGVSYHFERKIEARIPPYMGQASKSRYDYGFRIKAWVGFYSLTAFETPKSADDDNGYL